MPTISEKLALLMNTKNELKAALTEKGQSVSDGDVFAAYPGKTRAIATGAQLPALANPGAASDLASGKQLIGPDGSVVTGNVDVRDPTRGIQFSLDDTALGTDESSLNIYGKYGVNYLPVLIRPGTTIGVPAPLEMLGNATAADVAAGKTFASAAGVMVAGTGSIAPEKIDFTVVNNCPYPVTLWYGHNNFGGCSAGESVTIPVEEGGIVAIVCGDGAFGVGDYTSNVYLRFVTGNGNNSCAIVNVSTNDPSTGTSPGTPTITFV